MMAGKTGAKVGVGGAIFIRQRKFPGEMAAALKSATKKSGWPACSKPSAFLFLLFS